MRWSRSSSITYIEQSAPLGLAHALLTAEDYLGQTPFVMYLGDNLLRDGIVDLVEEFRRSGPDALILLTHVDDPSSYGVAELNGDRVVRLIEKPRKPPNQTRGTGNCIFRSRIFEYVPLTPINQNRQERELPDLIQCAIDDGLAVKSFDIGDGYVNINTPADIEVAERAHAARCRTQPEERP